MDKQKDSFSAYPQYPSDDTQHLCSLFWLLLNTEQIVSGNCNESRIHLVNCNESYDNSTCKHHQAYHTLQDCILEL